MVGLSLRQHQGSRSPLLLADHQAGNGEGEDVPRKWPQAEMPESFGQDWWWDTGRPEITNRVLFLQLGVDSSVCLEVPGAGGWAFMSQRVKSQISASR